MAQLSDNRLEPMFRDRSLNRAEIATDLAIPLLAEGGWPAMTIAAVAARGNMKRQSVAQWFGSGAAFREQVAWRYAWRWAALLSSQLVMLYSIEDPDAATVAQRLLPTDEDGIVFARVWLAICEAGRSDESIAAAVRHGEAGERELIEQHLTHAEPSTIRAVCALLHGLRAQVTAVDGLSLEDAFAATEVLRRTEELRR